MARDAIARLYDVDKNTVHLDIGTGVITFTAKPGKSIDLDKIHASIQATRLSGRTGMALNWLDVTATGRVMTSEEGLRLKVAGTGQEFILAENPNARPAPGEKSVLQRLREAATSRAGAVSVTGRLEGWSGPFPQFLRALPGEAAPDPARPGAALARTPPTLLVTEFKR